MREHEFRRCTICEFSEHFCDCEHPNLVTEEEYDQLKANSKPISLEDMKAAFPGHKEENYLAAIELGYPHPIEVADF